MWIQININTTITNTNLKMLGIGWKITNKNSFSIKFLLQKARAAVQFLSKERNRSFMQ
jgi:hypothetical protein